MVGALMICAIEMVAADDNRAPRANERVEKRMVAWGRVNEWSNWVFFKSLIRRLCFGGK